MRGGLVKVAVGVVAIGVIGAGAVLLLDRPVVPTPSAGAEPVARTTILPPDPNEPVDPNASQLLVATQCLERIQRPGAFADLCWSATRHGDADPMKDYYALELRGTFGGSGVRWLAVETRLVEGTPFPGTTDGLPSGDGAGCVDLPSRLIPPPGTRREQLCGRIVGGPGAAEGSWRLTWTCEPCMPFDDADRAIALRSEVIVGNGQLPNWEIFANVGR